MASGLIAVFVEASAVIGGLAGLGYAFWTAADAEQQQPREAYESVPGTRSAHLTTAESLST
jgi:hypothetical protein